MLEGQPADKRRLKQAGQRILTALHLRRAAKQHPHLAADLLAIDMGSPQPKPACFILRTLRRGFPGG